MVNNDKGKHVYTVKQVNFYIRQIFEGDFILKNISVKGEISNCKYHSSGHIYFSLKDPSGVISCVMFASNARSLKFRLEDGTQVVVNGSISVYEAAGRYQLYARTVEEAGQGDLFKKFEELKASLEEAGFFASEYKKAIPPYSYRIGVVTSETGAVIRDIFNVASRRNPYAQILLYPALVQGEGAKESIAAGIKALEKKDVDVIIIGRGGGSIEDLWAFNEEMVARAIFDCTKPVISAVGHETDFTIADFVADLRAPTPSAAAELAVFDYSLFEKELADYRYTLKRSMTDALTRNNNMTEKYMLVLQNLSPKQQLLQKKQKLSDAETALEDIISGKLKDAHSRLDEAAEEIALIAGNSLNRQKNRLAVISERLSGMSPLKRLSEGYVYASIEGKTLRSVKQIKKGDAVEITAADGRAEAVISNVIHNGIKS